MTIDIHTLAILLGITNVLQLIAISIQYLLNKTSHGIGWWVLGFASGAVGFGLLLLRESIPIELISIIFTNALLILGIIFQYVGIMRFLAKTENRWIIISILAVYLLSFSYFTYVRPDVTVRSIFFSVILTTISFLIAQGLLANKTRPIAASANLIAALFLAQGCYFAFRAVLLFTDAPVNSIFTPTLAQASSFLQSFIEGILLTFGLIVMVNQQLNAENREAKENLERIFNTSPDAVLITRLSDGHFATINDGFAAMTGFTRDEVVGKSTVTINLYQNPADRQKIIAVLNEKGFCDNLEVVFLRKDGGQLIGLVSAKLITLQDTPHVISVTRDITKHKQAEQEKQKADAMIRTLSVAIEQSPVTTVITDLAGNIVFVNPKFTESTGYSAEEAIGQNPRILKSGDKSSAEYKELWDTILAGQNWHGVFQNKKKNGELYWESAVISPVKDADGTITHFLAVKEDITERKRTEEALRESEQRWQTIINTSPDGISIASMDGVLQYVSKKLLAMHGYERPEEMVGRPMFEFLDAAYQEIAIHKLDEMLNGRYTGVAEYKLIKKDGSQFYMDINAEVLRDESGKPTSIFFVERDVTARKEAENKVRETNAYLENLFNYANAPIIVWDPQFRITRFNHAFEFLTGRSEAEVIGQSLEMLFPPALAENSMALIRKTLTGERWETVEIKILHRDQSVRTVLWNSATLFAPDDQTPIATIAQGQDITERKQAEEVLAQERNLLRTLLDNLPDRVYIKDAECRYVINNPVHLRSLGVTQQAETLGRTAFDFFPQPLAAQFHADEQAIIRSDQPMIEKEENMADLPTGQPAWHLTTKVPLRNSKGKVIGLLGVSRDITERKRLEAELQQQATTDELTGVYNRRHFLRLAQAELVRATRLKHPMTIALIDIDHFKHINDTYGHAAGDQSLIAFAKICKRNIREIDVFARFGGDEFALLLPETNCEQAYEAVERVCLALTAQPIDLDGNPSLITVSAGIGSLTSKSASLDTLLGRADQALYRAKEAGRNRVVVHIQPLTTESDD